MYRKRRLGDAAQLINCNYGCLKLLGQYDAVIDCLRPYGLGPRLGLYSINSNITLM